MDRACVEECESFLRSTQQGSVCGLRKKSQNGSDFEGTLIESERAGTNAHKHEYADMFGNDLRVTDSFGAPVDMTGPIAQPLQVDHSKCFAALIEGIDALRDIINAAGNDQPHSAEELERLFSPALEQMREAVGDD